MVGKLMTHFQTVDNFPTSENIYFLGGEIVDPFLKGSSREIVDQTKK